MVTKENLESIISKLGEEELGKRIKSKDLGIDIYEEVTKLKIINKFLSLKTKP